MTNTKNLDSQSVALLLHVFSLYANSWQAAEDAKRVREAEKESLFKYKSQSHGIDLTEDEQEEIEIRQTFPSFEQVIFHNFVCFAIVFFILSNMSYQMITLINSILKGL